jgi:hypothetical protein
MAGAAEVVAAERRLSIKGQHMALHRWLTAMVLTTGLGAGVCAGQLILNEANAIGPNGRWIDQDTAKPYEGFDYGVVPHSMNNNSPIAAVDPGNPFPVVNALDPAQETLPNGWAGTTGWARILENGGDWVELVVTEDNADLRGYTLYWENDDNENGLVGDAPDERGIVGFTQDPFWAQLRAGTIITISEDNLFFEIRDAYPLAPSNTNVHATGFNYDLGTDLSYDPIGVATQLDPISFFGDRDWHVHLWLDEGTTVNIGQETQYFRAGSDIRVDNDGWRMAIYDATNPDPIADRETGLVQGLVGETAPGWGAQTGAGGVNSRELIALVAEPVSNQTTRLYEDVDFSTFGRANLFNDVSEATLDGVQDFTALWTWVRLLTTGDSDFDNDVDMADVDASVAAFTGPGSATTVRWSEGSFDGDGDADNTDILLASANYTAGSSGVSGAVALVYDATSGAVWIDTRGPAEATTVIGYVLSSETNFDGAAHLAVLPGTVTSSAAELSEAAPYEPVSGILELGRVLPAGLSEAALAATLVRADYVSGLGAPVSGFTLVHVACDDAPPAAVAAADCVSGVVVRFDPGCNCADVDHDGDVDLADLSQIQRSTVQ